MSRVHVVGAGLAGLAAALTLTGRGRAVTVHEAGPAAGGRCRSYFDRELGLLIDNGNHLLLKGNRAACGYITETGAWDRMAVAETAVFPFVDLRTDERWAVRLNPGRLPWWVLRRSRRVPRTTVRDYLRLARIARIGDDTVVADSMRQDALYAGLLEPFAVAALNTPPETALARLLGAVMRESLLLGGQACRPMLPRHGLSDALVDPAVATLHARGATVLFNSRITAADVSGNRVAALRAAGTAVALGPDDSVVLAVPPWIAAGLLPDLTAPDAFQAILNIHFRTDDAGSAGPHGGAGFVGLVGGTGEWVFRKPGHVSVTISAANRLVDEPAAAIAARVWPDVVDALQLDTAAKQIAPPFRVVKERRATFAATAQQEARRAPARSRHADNLALAGDWTSTGLPATIEGAIRSGRTAADLLLSR